MPSKYKLIYFPLTGRAEMTRLLFAAAGVEYEDSRVKYEDWPKLKPDMPQNTLPVLVIDGKTTITQSYAIARYVAKELRLYGKNNVEAAYIDEILDTIIDLGNAVIPSFIENDKAKKAELRKKFDTEDAPKFLGFIEKEIESYGKDGFAVSSSLSLADVTIYSVIEFFDMKGLLEKFPKITANMKQVEANKNIAKYLKERPPSELPPRLREQPAEENTRI